jgi:hypothetical protein
MQEISFRKRLTMKKRKSEDVGPPSEDTATINLRASLD